MRDPKERFTDRAKDYARYRPPYAEEAYDAILDGLAAPVVAADLGAGTGISSQPLVARGVKVFAVEPNAAMRAEGKGLDVEWRAGSGEETGLPDASVDLVLAGQAFHWFDVAQAFPEMRRILRPGGRVALMWNLPDDEDPVGRQYDALLLEVRDPCAVDRRNRLGAPLLESSLFRNGRRLVFPHVVPTDEAELLGRAVSASYFPKEGAVHDDLVRRLKELHQSARDADGNAPFGYQTVVWLAEVEGQGLRSR